MPTKDPFTLPDNASDAAKDHVPEIVPPENPKDVALQHVTNSTALEQLNTEHPASAALHLNDTLDVAPTNTSLQPPLDHVSEQGLTHLPIETPPNLPDLTDQLTDVGQALSHVQEHASWLLDF